VLELFAKVEIALENVERANRVLIIYPLKISLASESVKLMPLATRRVEN
jgi:hypothetical protein